MWLPEQQEVTHGKWQDFMRIFTDGTIEKRYITEIIFGARRPVTYWQITTDTEKLAANQTWYVTTNLTEDFLLRLGNLYGFRNQIEYAFKQAKNELGWADFRVTNYETVENWWEVVMSAYLLVSLQTIERQPKQIPETANEFESLASFEASIDVEPPK